MPRPEMLNVISLNGTPAKVPADAFWAGAYPDYSVAGDQPSATTGAAPPVSPWSAPVRQVAPLPDASTTTKRVGDRPAPTTKEENPR